MTTRITSENELHFGPPEVVDASLSETVRGLVGSEILRIAAEIREHIAAGNPVCNLTVGDFDPRQFPIPAPLLAGIQEALKGGETNYPPSDGVLSLRNAVAEYTARERGIRYPTASIVIASGARPILYSAFRSVLDPGDTVLYTVPSWNNNHYAWIASARPQEVRTRPESGFQPVLEDLLPHLSAARLLCLNSPLNPSGTMMDPERLRSITLAVLEENARRTREGRKHLFLLYDEVYGSLVFGNTPHAHPAALVPESAPWVISLDGISKAFAATGLRVGWVLAAPAVAARMRDLLGHMGAWAPRAEQVATARFLGDAAEVAVFRTTMDARVRERLEALHRGFTAMKSEGFPVDCVRPEGGIYLSLRLDLIGRAVAGRQIATNDDIRHLLLERAGLAVVPFQAFGLKGDTGWFRMSVGAVSLGDIEQVFPRLRALLGGLH